VFLPFTQAYVPVVDIKAGRLVADPPAGLLDGGEAEDRGEDADLGQGEMSP
jgi:16S rRNA processing protein RimM